MQLHHTPQPAVRALILQMSRGYQAFLEACQGLSLSQALMDGACGVWSGKAVVDHLTGWQVESLSVLDQLLDQPGVNIDIDIEAFNQRVVKEKRAYSWEESLNAFQESFESFIYRLEVILQSQNSGFEGIQSWVKAMTHEYQLHIIHIREALNY